MQLKKYNTKSFKMKQNKKKFPKKEKKGLL